MGASFVFIAGSIYARHKSKRTAGIAAAAVNYFLLLPLFEGFMPLNGAHHCVRRILPFIYTKLDVALFKRLALDQRTAHQRAHHGAV